MERTNRKTIAISIMLAVIVLAIAFMALFASSSAITAKATPTAYEGGETLTLDDLRVGDVISGAYETVTGDKIIRLASNRYSAGESNAPTGTGDWGPIAANAASFVNNDGTICFRNGSSFDFYPFDEKGQQSTAWVVTKIEVKDETEEVYFGGKSSGEQPSYDSLAVSLDEDFIENAPWDSQEYSVDLLPYLADNLTFTPTISYDINDTENVGANLYPDNGMLVIMMRDDTGEIPALEALFNKGADLTVTFNGYEAEYHAEQPNETNEIHGYITGVGNLIFIRENTTYSLQIVITREQGQGGTSGGQQSGGPVTVYFTQLQKGDHISAGTRIMYDEYDSAPFTVIIDGGLTEQLVDSSGETPYFELQEDVTVALKESYDDHYLFLLSSPVLPEGVLYIAGVDVATIKDGGTIDAQTEGAVGILSGSVTVEFVDTWNCNVAISFNNFVYQGEGYTAGDGISAAIHHTGIERLLIRYNGQNSLTVTGENAYGIYSGNPKGRIELIGASGESTDSFSISAENGYGIGGEIGEKSYIVIGGNMTVSGKIGANIEQLDVWNPYGGSVTIIGTDKAVLDLVRSNDLAGTGWTDVNGTQGETNFAATEMGNVAISSQYKRLRFVGRTGDGSGGGQGGEEETVTFGKVTDVSQITAENIGECSVADAKEWIYANWETVFDGLDQSQNVVFAFFNEDKLPTFTFSLQLFNSSKDSFMDNYLYPENLTIDYVVEYYQDYNYIVYLCGFNGGSGGGQQGGSAKPIALGTTYYYGDEIEFSGGEYVYSYEPNNWKYAIQAGTYEVREPDTYSSGYFFFNEWLTGVSGGTVDVCATFPDTNWNFDSFTGIRCSGGDGSEENPYVFELITDENPQGGSGEQGQGGDPEPATHTHNDVTFTAWESTTSLPGEEGNYYLTADVTLSSSWNVPAGETNLCLNGHGIKVTGVDSVIYIASGRTLNVYDCGDTVHYFDRDSTNRFAININETEGSGRNSFVGGYIAGGKGKDNQKYGGGVYVNGTFNLYGGNIIGNTLTASDNCGAGVYCNENSIFRMYGGSISYNYAQNAGCAIFGWKNCSIEIHGGEISYNKTNWSSGSAISFWNPAGGYTVSLKLYGGFIHDNSSLGGEGAVNLVTASPTVGLKGGLIVRDNTTDSTAGNAALNVYVGTNPINIEGALSSDAKICIRLSSGTGVFTSGWSTYMGSADPADYFVSENDAYQVYLLDGEAAILAEDPNAPAVTLGAGLLYVGGVDIVTAENYTVNGNGGGKAVYSEDEQGNRFLTLTDYVYTGPGYSDGGEGGGIDYRGGGTLTILLVGNSSITKADDGGIRRSHGIYLNNGTLIIDGTGSLTIGFADDRGGWKSNGIFNESGSFVMNGGTVVSNAGVGDESAGIYAGSGITFNGGNFTGNGNYTTDYESRGIYSHGTITVNGGTVCGTAPLDNNYEARAFDGSVTINAGTLTAYGKVSFSWGVQCGANSTWTILAGDDEASATQVGGVDGSEKYVHIVAQSAVAHAHDYETAWTTDDVGHWHACVGDGECDAPYGDYGEHSYSDDISDVAYYTCSVCGYENATRKSAYEAQQPGIYVASVTVDGETTEYTSLIEAYEACPEGGTIVLLENVDISNSGDGVYVTVEKDLNIDLHGHTLKFKYTLTSAQIILSGGHVLTIDNSVPEKGGIKGFIEVADDGSYVLLRNCRLIFGKTALASTADINHIAPFFTVENIDEDGFLSLIRPMTDDELVELAEELIDEIPDPPVNNDETKDAIDEARKVYDMLPEDKKEEVENRQKLFDAEDEYARLNNTKWSIKIRAKSTSSVDYTAYIDDGETIVRVYDATLYRIDIKDGVEQEPIPVQPSALKKDGTGTITVKLTIPDLLSGKTFRILHVHGADDYAFVDFETDADGKHVTIRGVDKLSDFAFVALQADLIPSDPGSGEQGQGEQGQGGDDEQGGSQGQGDEGQGYKPLEIEPEITKEDDPTKDNLPLVPQGGQGGDQGQSGTGEQSGNQGQGGTGEQSGNQGQGDQGEQRQPAKPAVTIALEDTDPEDAVGVTVEVEVKTEVSEEVTQSDNNVLSASLQSDDEIAIVYDVRLIRTTIENGIEIREEIQPSDIKPGTVVVINMLIPEELRGKAFRLLHIHSEEDVKEVTAYTVSEDGTTLTVRVDRLSEFAFVAKKAAATEEVNEPNKISDGAIAGIVIGGAFGVLFLGLLVFFLLKRKKSDESDGAVAAKESVEAVKAETKAAIIVAAPIVGEGRSVGFYRITKDESGACTFVLFYKEGDNLSKEIGVFESEKEAYKAIKRLRERAVDAKAENRVKGGAESLPAPKFVLDVDAKGVYRYSFIDEDATVLMQSVTYLNENRCLVDLKKTLTAVGTEEIVVENGELKADVIDAVEEMPAETVIEEVAAADAVEERIPALEAHEEIVEESVSEEAPAEEVEAEAEGVSLKENIAVARETVSHSAVNKQYVADYLKAKYDEGVRLNQRGNETKTGLPLADTHYAIGEEKNRCFVYVYEVEGTTMLLVKVDDAYGAALAEKHPIVKRSAFPKSKSPWQSVIVDDSFAPEEIEKILDDAYLMNGGKKAADEGISLKETLAMAKATTAAISRTKKGIAEYLAERYGDKAELNLRGNETKTGLPLADTHYAVKEEGKRCFVYVYETEGAVVLLLRLTEAYAETVRAGGHKIIRSAFPKSRDAWFTVIPDDTYTEADIGALLDAAYDQAK